MQQKIQSLYSLWSSLVQPAIQVGAHCWCGACYAGCAADSEHPHAVGSERLHSAPCHSDAADLHTLQ